MFYLHILASHWFTLLCHLSSNCDPKFINDLNSRKMSFVCKRIARTFSIRRFASEVDGAGTSTGIEHALKFKQMGMSNKRDFEKEYKCIEYLHMNKYSYYDTECELLKYRAPQPSNKHPDQEPKFKEQKEQQP